MARKQNPDAAPPRPSERPDGKEFGKPEGAPIDQQMPRPGYDRDEERSDRSSGRPLQLDDDSAETPRPGRGDKEPDLGGHGSDRPSWESDPAKR